MSKPYMHTNIIGIFSFQNGFNHPFISTGLYFKSKTGKASPEIKKCFVFQHQGLGLFSSVYISEVLIFFLADCLSNQLIFSVAVHMFRVHVFDKAFFFSATVIMITENVTISSFHINHSKENKVFHHNHAICESK